ncbi:hypothetical protein ABZP36_015858 [Zizania latifolia]
MLLLCQTKVHTMLQLLFFRKVSGSLLTWRKLCINHPEMGGNKCLYSRTERIFLFFIPSSQRCVLSLGPPSSNHKSVLQSKKIISGTSQDASNQLFKIILQ